MRVSIIAAKKSQSEAKRRAAAAFAKRREIDRKQHAAYKADAKQVEAPKPFKAIKASSYRPAHSEYTNYSG